jgi:hypothetical protein
MSSYPLDKIPGNISIVPTESPRTFHYDFMRDFVRQNPFFFIKEIEVNYSYRENHNERTMGTCILTNKKYDPKQQIYIIEGYILQNSNELFQGNSKHLRLLRKMIDFYLGIYEPNEFLLKDILELIYPHLVVEDTPEDGDCYFHAIGMNVDKTAQEVRNILSDQIVPDIDIPILMSGYNNETLLKRLYLTQPDEFKSNFCQILKQCSNYKGVDGVNCFWGGDDFDPILSKIFDNSICSFSYLIMVDHIEPSQHPIASQIPIFMWNMVWKDFFNKMFLSIGKDFKRFQYQFIINKTFENKPRDQNLVEDWIGHLHIGQHFFAVCENKK